ncbi:hypothetical protein K440DRAFT_642558 [Wilcoxina mikolae CBS 423.85]|nr:hypothetical protein K440DRAFT_642558 [Wilcoxina mikolae CBS 423.85]
MDFYQLPMAFYNSNNPTTAILLMINYCCRALFDATRDNKHTVDWSTLRAYPYFPNFTLADTTGDQQLLDMLKPIRASAPFLALGRYETSLKNLGNRVHVNVTELPREQNHNGRMIQFDYTYMLTGYEMGLQNAQLKYNVTGFCKTDYSGYSAVGDSDYWMLWPGY